jgi:hypothetical protein
MAENNHALFTVTLSFYEGHRQKEAVFSRLQASNSEFFNRTGKKRRFKLNLALERHVILGR